jgi:alpha-galactosidase
MTEMRKVRRSFLRAASRSAAGAASGRWALLPPLGGACAAAFPDTGAAAQSGAHIGDGVILLEYDANLHSRVAHAGRARGDGLRSSWSASECVERADGARVEQFRLRDQTRDDIVDAVHGKGVRLRLSGIAADGLEKRVEVRLFERFPGIALLRVTYRNGGDAPVALGGWTNAAYRFSTGEGTRAETWAYCGGTYPDRRDWVQPVKDGFAQDNFLGMTGSDYGGGTPVVDFWRREGGFAVGHVDAVPRLVSLPLQRHAGTVQFAVHSREPLTLAPRAVFETPETFVAVHRGDYFATLDTYRRIMAERGLRSPETPAASYEPIWCAWGYERDCSTAMIEGTLAKARDVGLDWAVIDDGWQAKIGDWGLDTRKYPRGEADMKDLVKQIRAAGLKPRLWFSPLSVAPGADLLHDHPDMLLLDKDGVVQNISWWNTFYLCPAYAPTRAQAQALVRKFIGEWGFAGLKIDGQHLNSVAPCFNPAHRHPRPEESVEGLHDFYRAMFDAAREIDPEVVMELCPCGTSFAFHNFPYMNQAPASDPESSWQVRHKGKTLKALMGPSAPFAGDHVELSEGGADFASTLGVGAVVSTKFTWPVDPKPKDSFLLTPEKEAVWRKWIALYRDKMLPTGRYRGELYDIGFDRPEGHAVEKDGKLYYAFYAPRWQGPIELRGLGAGPYRVRDYVNNRELGTVRGANKTITTAFEHFLLVEAEPA